MWQGGCAIGERGTGSQSVRASTPADRLFCVLQRTPVAVALVILAALLPRILTLDRFVTADEYLWVIRSGHFACALRQRDWAGTFQREHPGVTTTWAGVMGLWIRVPDPAAFCERIVEQGHEQALRGLGVEPIAVLEAGRFFMVLFNVSALAIAFLYARRLLGSLPALLGFFFIALDPFHVAHSRLLHLDGLLSSLMLLALLGFSSYLRSRRTLDLIVSGAVTGLACLTKSPALVMLPIMVVLDLLYLWWNGRATPLWAMVLWGAAAVTVFVALWPAMWVEPTDAILSMLQTTSEYAQDGHSTPLFFAGRLFEDGKIGASVVYYYPLSYLWRTTPVVLVGLLALGACFVLWRRLGARREMWWTAVELAVFGLTFTFVLNLSAKKFDRYLLPVHLALDLLAALGWVIFVRWLSGRRAGSWRRAALPVLLGAVFVAQMIGVLRTYPYYLSYYNPALGGSRNAPQTMQIGWGEGLDQAARYLNEKPDADRLHVASWYAPGCFSYLFRGSYYSISPRGLEDDDLQNILNADYVVLYTTHQMQRHAALPLLNALSVQEPEYLVQINGIEYARVYRTNSDMDVDPTYERVDAVIGQKILLEGFSVSQRSLAPGDILIVSLSWKTLAAPRERLKVFVHLVDSSGRPVAQHDGEPIAWHGLTDTWQPGETYIDRHGIVLPSDIAAGDYRLLVGMYRYSGERLPLTVKEREAGDAIELGAISVRPGS